MINHTIITDRVQLAMVASIKEKGFVSPIDVLLQLGILDQHFVTKWRQGHVLYLEKRCICSLDDLGAILREMRQIAASRRLIPSWSCYVSEGAERIPLQFSKNNAEWLERLYATHYIDRNRLNELKTPEEPCATRGTK